MGFYWSYTLFLKLIVCMLSWWKKIIIDTTCMAIYEHEIQSELHICGYIVHTIQVTM